ncbi:Rz1-like lysis system protein LysC [Pseudomonas peli]|uniref:Rz1-like lysis system protein LysC n=1 Tax=Pseudomonas peli TaxID=592361 RepID=UPI00286BE2A7|nr:Rz1-like lysis system protein LysC [Pseudomonas peli]
MTRVLVIGAASLSLALLAGCMSAPALPEHTVTVSGCPVVTPCSLLPAAPQINGQLSDDSDYLLSAWAECAAQVDMIYSHHQPRADP